MFLGVPPAVRGVADMGVLRKEALLSNPVKPLRAFSRALACLRVLGKLSRIQPVPSGTSLMEN